jgi:cytochrome c-type biogenesis protein CcsB
VARFVSLSSGPVQKAAVEDRENRIVPVARGLQGPRPPASVLGPRARASRAPAEPLAEPLAANGTDMTKILNSLASLKLAVILLVVLLVGLSTGTILESSRGVAFAQSTVYYAWWFLALEGLLAVNVIASLAVHFPWGKWRLGFLLTHGGLVVTLVGAAITYFASIDAQLGLWEGQSGDEVTTRDRLGAPGPSETLPFTVRLEDFQIDYYPGTMRPAMFRSLVQITDKETGASFPGKIWMNNPLQHRGYTLFQSSYQQPDGPGGREASIFTVSRDPGQPVAFLGYALLTLGMCVVLGTRVVQARRRAQLEAEAGVSLRGRKVAAAMIAAALATGASAAAPADVEALRRLPVQHDGRSMPLDTQAREAVWKVTGGSTWRGEDAVVTVTRWMFEPAAAANEPLVAIEDDFAEAVGLAGKDHASFAQLVGNRKALQLMQDAQREAAAERRRTGALADAEKVEERLNAMQRFLDREALRVIPVAGDPVAKWAVPSVGSADELAQLAAGPRLPGWPSADAIEREILYKKVRPVRVAWIVLLGAVIVSILAWNRRSKLLDGVALGGLVVGFAVMSWGIWMRWQVAGRIPASNMYESLLFLAWGVGLFAVVAFAFMRNRLVVLNANAMAAVTMALTDLLPIDRFIHPMPPVLSGTPWLAIHVPIIMVGYAVLGLGVVIAHMQVGFTIFAPKRTELIGRMYDLNYWYMHAGNILLIAGILTGSIWAASSWGRYWGWDPKEVWSLVAFLAYMAILHAKVERLLGEFGVAAISIVAFQTILMTYLGVNYVLGTGMHSYGMGDSPIVIWMTVIALVEAAFITWGWLAYRKLQAAEASE